MTAINVVLLPGVAHVFADGGHYDGKVLRRIGSKVYALPRLNAVLAWSGPSFDADCVLNAIARCRAASLPDLIDRLPAAVALMGWQHPFSAIVVGVYMREAMGVAVEEGGRVNNLSASSVIRTLSSPVKFDPTDIVGSGIAMMEDQRARHGVAAGFIEHIEIGERITARALRHWPDLVAGGAGLTHAVKIGDLEVDTINFKPQSVTGAVTRSGNGSITIPNASSFPVTLTALVNYAYYGNGSSNGARCTMSIVRTRGSVTLADVSGPNHSGSTSGVQVPGTLSAVAIDSDAAPSDVYTFTAAQETTGSGPGAFGIIITSSSCNGFYTKK